MNLEEDGDTGSVLYCEYFNVLFRSRGEKGSRRRGEASNKVCDRKGETPSSYVISSVQIHGHGGANLVKL